MDHSPALNALEARFPAVTQPRLELGSFPTPVVRLDQLERTGRVALWCKRDDLAGGVYGGNKVRKLEYLLAAVPPACKHIITFGATGSHHLLASAIYARQQGLHLHGVLVPQPENDHVLQNRAVLDRVAASLWPVASQRHLPGGLLRAWNHVSSLNEGRPHIIPPGGSGPVGNLGWVVGGLEIAAQVAAGEIPQPDDLFVALGTMGTAAGLLLGLRLGGMSTRVCAIRVADLPFVTGPATLLQARNTLWYMKKRGLTPPGGFHLDGLDTWHHFAGAGYGAWTPAASEAVRLASERHGLRLETTYTGKALAACLDGIRAGVTGKYVLFVNTVHAGAAHA